MIVKSISRKIQMAEVKRLRADARRLDVIAKHLRERASDITKSIKKDEKMEKARTNFFSKSSHVDPSLTLTPYAVDIVKTEKQLFTGV